MSARVMPGRSWTNKIRLAEEVTNLDTDSPIGAAAAGAVAMGMKYISDGVIGPGGEMVVSGPKGSIQLDKKDSIIAGTNLGGGGGGNKEDNSEMLGLLKQIANKSTVIEMGGNEVGQGINTAEREIQ